MSDRQTFNWQDPLNIDAMLSEEERMLRDSVHQFCQERLMTRVLKANREEHFDPKIMTEMGELGLLVQHYPASMDAPRLVTWHMA